MWYLIMAFVAGSGMAVQAAINSQLGKVLFAQPIYAAFWSFLTGMLVLFCLSWSVGKGQFFQAMTQVPQQPWWYLIGGFIGAGLVFSSIYLAPKLGVANMLFFMVLGQIICGVVIDSLGWFHMPVREISWVKISGVVLMIVGLAVFAFGDRLKSAFM